MAYGGSTIPFRLHSGAFGSQEGIACQRYGVRRILLIGMSVACLALAGFAAIAYAGTKGMVTGAALVGGVLLSRGLVFGVGMSTVAPAAQTHFITHADSEAARVKLSGMIGTSQGAASILGSVFGGVLAAIGGVLFPMVLMPVMMLIAIGVLAFTFHPDGRRTIVESPQSVSPSDPRVLPWLVAGNIMFLIFASVTTTCGFSAQDRFAANPDRMALLTAVYMVIMGLTMITTQVILAPRSGWGAAKLLRNGIAVFLVRVVALWPTSSYTLLAAACLLMGLGLGLAIPGYTTGPPLQMSNDEQGGVAGVVNENNGIAYAIAPACPPPFTGGIPWPRLCSCLSWLSVSFSLHASTPPFASKQVATIVTVTGAHAPSESQHYSSL